MLFVTTFTYRDSKSTLYTSNRKQAICNYNHGKADPDVSSVTGGILCADVQLGNRTYTFYADEQYKHGTLVNVPTRYGATSGRVMNMKVLTRQQLEALASKNRFAVSDYQTIIGKA